MHPMKSSEAIQNENNGKKLINLIPEANIHVEVTNRGNILPTPNTHHINIKAVHPEINNINNSQKNQTTRRPVNTLQQQQIVI